MGWGICCGGLEGGRAGCNCRAKAGAALISPKCIKPAHKYRKHRVLQRPTAPAPLTSPAWPWRASATPRGANLPSRPVRPSATPPCSTPSSIAHPTWQAASLRAHLVLVNIQPHHVVCMRVRRHEGRQQVGLRCAGAQHSSDQGSLSGGHVAGAQRAGAALRAPAAQLGRQHGQQQLHDGLVHRRGGYQVGVLEQAGEAGDEDADVHAPQQLGALVVDEEAAAGPRDRVVGVGVCGGGRGRGVWLPPSHIRTQLQPPPDIGAVPAPAAPACLAPARAPALTSARMSCHGPRFPG